MISLSVMMYNVFPHRSPQGNVHQGEQALTNSPPSLILPSVRYRQRNHQGKSTISLLRQIADRAAKKRHDPASGGVNPCVLTNQTRHE
jgi:hypothetical protein